MHLHVVAFTEPQAPQPGNPQLRVGSPSVLATSPVETSLLQSPSNRRFVSSRIPLVRPQSKDVKIPSSLASLNVNELKDDALENIDVSSLINLKELKASANVDNLSLSLGADMDISLDDLSDTDLSQVCVICMQDKPSEANQLIECSHCKKKFHTTCLHLPQIPYSTQTPMERRKRATYMEQHYKNWLCASCKEDPDVASMQSPSIANTVPGSPVSNRTSTIASPSFSPSLNPVPLNLEPRSLLGEPSVAPNPVGSPFGSPILSRPSHPVIKKALGTDLSLGGVVVGTEDYAAMQRALQMSSGAIPTLPGSSDHVKAPHLDASLVPIYTDSDSGAEESPREKVAPRSLLHSNHHKHIKPDKLASFLRSLLALPEKDGENDTFIKDVVSNVMQNANEAEMSVVCPIPMFVLKSMLKTAVFNPTSVPVSKVFVIDGKEVVRISDHPQLKAFFERLKKGEDVEAIKKDMVSEGLDPEVITKDPNSVVLLEDYTISFLRSDQKKEATAVQPGAGSQPQAKEDVGIDALSDNLVIAKYIKMLMRRIPRETVVECMKKDGVDPSILNELPSSVEESKKPQATKKMVKRCEHPDFAKYFNMLKKGVPPPGVRHCMMRDGVDPDVSV